ncbi:MULTISPECIES: site-2 protease family protein [Methanosarcina]|uniref:Sterol-regulatory element-binding protein intramembrane protease n=3 Tax=Methanosarcina barkeri TaxID=2208 RepID=A0A0E3QUP6_METBA|nr:MULTISPECIES: site-2 protease family protein [Methanosarcina]AKB55139.1 Sterol-regulatory element-binding protein intramembrane protease [Methanosarcina barkeri MS]AKB56783.1 Sterol-regulatory element-binding protein intramembrane protease [Methanosarcina barkeri 227]AKJ37362.1 peptidase M50 family [Methanosarcina barkeri CM1]OED07206.1 peptidase [Methanosarcina sp. A14]
MNGTSIALSIFLLYWLAVSVLDRKGILEKYNISTFGPLPILMIRTTKGLKLLDVLARPKSYWRIFANLGILLMFAGMIAMFLVIAISDLGLYTSFLSGNMPDPGKYNSPRNIFLIPGLNEFIPLTWGAIALIVTLVVHEFSHAILCRVEGIRVKSMGILYALVPIGGFAEPDDEQLFGTQEKTERELPLTATIEEIEEWEKEEKIRQETEKTKPDEPKSEPVIGATRTQRSRILAAGVMANFTVAFIALLLFFGPVLGAIAPLSDAMILSVNESSPADHAGLENGMIITQINDTNITTAEDLLTYLEKTRPGDTVHIYATKNGTVSTHDLQVASIPEDYIGGVPVGGIVSGSPAEAAGIKTGMTMIRINNTKMQNVSSFVSFMETTKANQTVEVELLPSENYTGNLTEKGTVVFDVQLSSNSEHDYGFLGVMYGNNAVMELPMLGISMLMPQAKLYLEALKQIPSLLTIPAGWIILFGLPIYGFAGEGFRGFSGTFMQFYQPVGWAEPLGIGIFWIANTLLWVGWLNFYVGLFNCLPAVPLDGGHVFKDSIYSFVYRLTRNDSISERVSNSITASFSMLILFSFIFMIFGPYIGQWM